MMNLTPQQALVNYHACYNNTAYSAATDEIAWMLGAGNDLSDEALRQTPDYITLSNMLTNVALEICGHPHYHGEGWQLATSLNAVTEPRLKAGDLDQTAIRKLWQLIDGYFGIYRHHMQEFYATLAADVQAKATLQVETAWTLTEEAVRAASDVPHWNGRAAYHLTGAAEGILRTANLMLAQQTGETSPSRFGYAAHKFGRAIGDLCYALAEIQPHTNGTPFFARVRDALSQVEEV